jgi:hypothetical protein
MESGNASAAGAAGQASVGIRVSLANRTSL